MAAVAVLQPAPAVSAEPVILLLEGARREIQTVKRGGAELVSLDLVISGLPVSIVTDRRKREATLTFGPREVRLFHDKSLAALDGDLRLLSAPSRLESGRWLLPLDAVPELLGPLLDRPAQWRARARVLIVGALDLPSIEVRTEVSGENVRVILDASERVPFHVTRSTRRVHVEVLHDAVDVDFQQQRLTGGIVDQVVYEGGRRHIFSIGLGPRFGELRAVEALETRQLVLDFQAAPQSAGTAQAPLAPEQPAARADRAVQVVVIDPGHGGEDIGARGAAGGLEKDVTLAIARKLRAYLVNQLGLQVFLTRDGDREVDLDQRTAIANNYKADLFVSIHANASRGRRANGSEVYFLSYQATDAESRRVALAEGIIEGLGPAAPELGSDLALILWDMAQAEHLEESSALASRLQEALADVTGSQGRGVKQAPFRVLVGAGMPAVLVEVAFISNPKEEKLLLAPEYQSRVAAALMRGIRRYEVERARRVGLPQPVARPGS